MKKKKKIAILIFSVVVLSSVLTGCSNTVSVDKTYNSENKYIKSMFTEVERADSWSIVYDKDTKVMYAVSSDSYNFGNFTLLVDENGNPKLWDGE